jgi:hypothetical protein
MSRDRSEDPVIEVNLETLQRKPMEMRSDRPEFAAECVSIYFQPNLRQKRELNFLLFVHALPSLRRESP